MLATSSKERILELDADCVLYAPLMADAEDVTALLRSGKNVVTPVAWIYPSDRQRARLEEACSAGGTTLHGTGVNPGGIPDLHPLMFSALSSGVRFVRGEEFSDIRSYDAPDVVRHVMGFGGTPEDTRSGPDARPALRRFRAFGADVPRRPRASRRTRRSGPTSSWPSPRPPIDSPIGVIEPGRVAGQRFVWEALVRDQVVVRVAVNWLMGEEHLEPAWSFGSEGERFEVEVHGDPDTFVTIKGWQPATVAEGLERNPGIVVTAMHCVNSIPAVCAAGPGCQDVRRPAAGHRAGPPRPGLNAPFDQGGCATIPPS